jgi:hypothetical protein
MGRGRHASTLEKMEKIYAVAHERQPVSVRGIAYPLFVQYGLIPSMEKDQVDSKVGRLVTEMREHGELPWEWISDNTHVVREPLTWPHPAAFLDFITQMYRLDYWRSQPTRVWLWSEKATVGSVLNPILEDYQLPFLAHGGFASTTAVWKAAQHTLDSVAPVTILYIGDWDVSGAYMSEVDLPDRLQRYGGEATLTRLAVTPEDVQRYTLPSFPVTDKKRDSRYDWWRDQGCGQECWELDALDPRDLRRIVEEAVLAALDVPSWERARRREPAQITRLQELLAPIKDILEHDAE